MGGEDPHSVAYGRQASGARGTRPNYCSKIIEAKVTIIIYSALRRASLMKWPGTAILL